MSGGRLASWGRVRFSAGCEDRARVSEQKERGTVDRGQLLPEQRRGKGMCLYSREAEVT